MYMLLLIIITRLTPHVTPHHASRVLPEDTGAESFVQYSCGAFPVLVCSFAALASLVPQTRTLVQENAHAALVS